jgi:predicted enzyme related to lactoylglutathione lyase
MAPIGGSMQAHYLEIVTPDVDAMCAAYAAVIHVQFGDPDPVLGNARTTKLPGGGTLGIRAPLSEDEAPVVRPYWLVEDLDAAVQRAESAGAQIALPRMELADRGTIAIYILGGVQHGLWQL